MKDKIEKIISALNKELEEVFDDFQGIYLAGIYTDYQPHEDEDITLVGIFNQEDKEKREHIWRIIGKVEVNFDVFIDFYPMTKEELENDEEFFEDVVINGIFYKPDTIKA